MGFRSGFMKGLKGVQNEGASKGELVPTDRSGSRQVAARNQSLPSVRTPRSTAVRHDEPELVQYQFDEVVRPGAPLVRFEMWCSATGQPFLAVAERHGDTLYIVGSDPVDGEIASSGWPGGYNYFAIDAAPGWRCPLCGVREDPSHDFLRLLWECGEYGCGGPLHCCGSSRGLFLCACGMRSRRVFGRGDTFKVYEYTGVRGASGYGLRTGEVRGGTVVTSVAVCKSAGTIVKRRFAWLSSRRR
jgi:hypothetical protein